MDEVKRLCCHPYDVETTAIYWEATSEIEICLSEQHSLVLEGAPCSIRYHPTFTPDTFLLLLLLLHAPFPSWVFQNLLPIVM